MVAATRRVDTKSDGEDDDDREEEMVAYIWIVTIVVASIAMALAGKFRWSCLLLFLAVLFWSIGYSLTPLSEAERKAIEYNIWSPEDCWEELKSKRNTLNVHSRLALLAALSKKYQKTLEAAENFTRVGSNKHSKGSNVPLMTRREEVALICHNAAFEAIDLDDEDAPLAVDQVVDAALALLALVAKESMVRCSYDQDVDRVEVVVKTLQRALLQAKSYRDEESEQRGAELQRKGCLLLGALANTTSDTANVYLGRTVIAKDGMKCILDALSWFRFHEQVANWALWAIFTLLYDEPDGSKSLAMQELMNANGGPIILAALENCGHELDVARHGIAIVFHIVVAKNISLPPVPVTNLVEQLLSKHSTEDLPTEASALTTSAQEQITLMGRDILVKLNGQQGTS